MSFSEDSTEIKEAKEATSLNDELSSLHELSLIEDEIISDFETPEEYLLYYSRIGALDKLKKLFDLVDRENTSLNVNVKGAGDQESVPQIYSNFKQRKSNLQASRSFQRHLEIEPRMVSSSSVLLFWPFFGDLIAYRKEGRR